MITPTPTTNTLQIFNLELRPTFVRFMKCIWDNHLKPKGEPDVNLQILNNFKTIAGVRSLFSEGYTALLVPDDVMERLDDIETERKTNPKATFLFHIYNEGELFGTVNREDTEW